MTGLVLSVLLILLVGLWPVYGIVRQWLKRRAEREATKIENERVHRNAMLDIAEAAGKLYWANEEAKAKSRNDPSRLRRQLAADLLFPGLYVTDETSYEMRADGVYNWIYTGTYTRDNPRHLLLISKVKELEAREKAEKE